MSKRGEEIRLFILDNVEHHPRDIVALVSSAYSISRQAVNKHVQKLTKDGALIARGSTKDRHYLLRPEEWELVYKLETGLSESTVWRDDVKPLLSNIPENVLDIWQYGVTEMFNNAIDHSSGTDIVVNVTRKPTGSQITIFDNGEGIFKKIQREVGLQDERHAVLELAKGKLTTDPDNHTGEGIFFSSRIFDRFAILSGSVYFSHNVNEVEDWILEARKFQSGTAVYMSIANNVSRTVQDIFDSFSSDEDYAFTKTVVPVRLAQYGDEKLVSRSQAKRLLVRIDKFRTVIFDFEGVETIGQAFADEVFRVFAIQYPGIDLIYLNADGNVRAMINRAIKARIVMKNEITRKPD